MGRGGRKMTRCMKLDIYLGVGKELPRAEVQVESCQNFPVFIIHRYPFPMMP